MKYTATGKYRGREVSITWEDGEVSGDPEAVAALRKAAADKAGEVVGIPGYHRTTYHHLKSALSAQILIFLLLGDADWEGELPEWPEAF